MLPVVLLLFSLPLAAQENGATLSATGSQPAAGRKNERPAPNLCEDVKRIAQRIDRFTATPVFQQALTALQDSLRTGRAQESSVSFGRNNRGDTILSAIVSGGRSSAPVPPVENAFADLHTHPSNTPPSSGDVYGLLEKRNKTPGYTQRFVLTGNGTLYVLFVQDTALAALFLRRYPPQRLAGFSPLFPEPLLDEFREIRYGQGVAEELAMARILDKYKAGVILFRQVKGEAIRWVRVTVSEEEPGFVSPAAACW
jgi:hypothetical protein